jgi:hypothetical protein
MVRKTGELRPAHDELLCYWCLKGSRVLYVLEEDGNTDNEQYVCPACAQPVLDGEAAPKVLQVQAVPGPPVSTMVH